MSVSMMAGNATQMPGEDIDPTNGIQGWESTAQPEHPGWKIEYNDVLFGSLWIVAVLILVGNIFTIRVISGAAHLRKATGLLMINLAAADIGVGITIVVPLIYAAITDRMSRAACDFFGFVHSLCWLESINTLVLLSLDRYLAIAYSLVYQSLVTSQRLVFAVAISWIVAIIFWILPLIGVGAYKFNDEEFACYFDVVGHPAQWMIYTGIIFIPAMLIIGFTYAKVGKIAWQTHRVIAATAVPAAEPDSPEKVNRKQNMKAFRTTAIVVGAFFVAWIPFVIEHIVKAAHGKLENIPEWLEIAIFVLALLNSALNPVIYMGTMKTFRMAALGAVTCSSVDSISNEDHSQTM